MARKKGGLLFGIIMGTLVGVLFAPGKGEELRKKIIREINEGGLGTKALSGDIKLMGHDIVDTAQDACGNSRVQGGVKSGRKNFKRLYVEIRDRLHSFLSKAKDADHEKKSG